MTNQAAGGKDSTVGWTGIHAEPLPLLRVVHYQALPDEESAANTRIWLLQSVFYLSICRPPKTPAVQSLISAMNW